MGFYQITFDACFRCRDFFVSIKYKIVIATVVRETSMSLML